MPASVPPFPVSGHVPTRVVAAQARRERMGKESRAVVGGKKDKFSNMPSKRGVLSRPLPAFAWQEAGVRLT